MYSDYGPFVLMLAIFLLLLAVPSVIVRAGFGWQSLWFGASVGSIIMFVVFDRRGPGISNYFGRDTEDFDLIGLLSGMCLYAAIAFTVAGCVYKPHRKKPGIPGK